MQIRAAIGVGMFVLGSIGSAFGQLGYEAAEQKIDECLSKPSVESVQVCRDAAKETYRASKDIAVRAKKGALGLLSMFGGFLAFSSNRFGKPDEKALKELEAKVVR
jgi:hypothetical protein